MLKNRRIAIVGAGPMGLSCAYFLIKSGFFVDIYEKDDRVGGMSASFNFGNLMIERYYHFITTPDSDLIELIKDIGISNRLRWTSTNMGFFYAGKLYGWGNPIYLLQFPCLDLLSKIRYGFNIFLSTKRKNWDKLDKINAIEWLKRSIGEKAYDICWSSLFDYKFYEYKNEPSAAWLWTRIRRIGLSRKNPFKDKLGYIEGGSAFFLETLSKRIKSLNGKINLNSQIEKVIIRNNKVRGIRTNKKFIPYDMVISTIPLPYLTQIVSDLPNSTKKQINSFRNIGVICVILKLKHRFSKYFWMNINDKRTGIPGIVEYSNLNPIKEHILYIPYYLPQNHAKFKKNEEFFVNEIINTLKLINPSFKKAWIKNYRVHRYYYAQPVCSTEFLKKLPPMKSEIEGFYMADTSYCYPEDRYMSESIKIGKKISSLL